VPQNGLHDACSRHSRWILVSRYPRLRTSQVLPSALQVQTLPTSGWCTANPMTTLRKEETYISIC
jgi:hypothetical protein